MIIRCCTYTIDYLGLKCFSLLDIPYTIISCCNKSLHFDKYFSIDYNLLSWVSIRVLVSLSLKIPLFQACH